MPKKWCTNCQDYKESWADNPIWSNLKNQTYRNSDKCWACNQYTLKTDAEVIGEKIWTGAKAVVSLATGSSKFCQHRSGCYNLVKSNETYCDSHRTLFLSPFSSLSFKKCRFSGCDKLTLLPNYYCEEHKSNINSTTLKTVFDEVKKSGGELKYEEISSSSSSKKALSFKIESPKKEITEEAVDKEEKIKPIPKTEEISRVRDEKPIVNVTNEKFSQDSKFIKKPSSSLQNSSHNYIISMKEK